MKYFFCPLFLLLLFSFNAQAQLSFGLKAGASSSHVDIKDPKNTLMQFKEKDKITGYHAGAFARVKLGGLVLQPEGVFTSSGGQVEVTQTDNGQQVTTTEDFKFTRLDVPLLVGVSFFDILRFQAGPVASVLVSGKFQDENLKDYMNKSDWGWQAGTGLDVGRLSADVRYEWVNRNYTNETQNSSYKVDNQQIIISLGYKILGK